MNAINKIKPYTIEREYSGEYELICKPGFSLDDGQHFAIEDTLRDIRKLAKQIKTCDCADCKRQLSSRYVMDDGYNVEFLGARPAKCGEDY